MKFFVRLIKLFSLLFLIAYPFGQLAKIPLPFLQPELKVYLTDIFLFLTLLTWLTWHWFRKSKIRPPPSFLPVLGFFGAAGFSLFLNSFFLTCQESLISSLYLGRWLIYAGAYFFVFDFSRRVEGRFLTLDNFTKILVCLGIIVAIFGLIQYLVWPDLRSLETAQWDPHYFRVVSTFLDPGFTGLILVFSLILIVGLFLNTPSKNKNQKKILVLAGVVIYLALALTYSRSSYLAYLIAAAVFSWFRKSTKLFLTALIILIITIVLLPRPGGEGVRLERWASIEARIRSWRNASVIFLDHPIFGVGFNSYRYAQRDYGFLGEDWQENHAGSGADSSLLFVLATTGIIGLAAYFWLWLKLAKISYSEARRKPMALAVFSTLAAVWVHSFFLNSLFYIWIMAWLWMLLASFEALKRVDK
jgi:O-antigen ligase